MTQTILSPPSLNGSIHLPSSKSISNRALILNALAGGSVDDGRLQRLADCDDTLVMTKALRFDTQRIDIGAAGTSMRFLTAFLAGKEGQWELTGSERMQQRPIRLLVDALNALGASITYTQKEGYPPLSIQGKQLKGGSIHIEGGISSQYLSALMMAAPCMQEGLTLHIEGELISKPYFHMTLELMRQWGVEADWDGKRVHLPNAAYRTLDFEVEADWSAASYWYEMLSLAESGKVELHGLRPNSLQGDARVAEWFEALGVHTAFNGEGVTLTQIPTLAQHFEADFTDQPDLAQTVAVTCALKGIPFELSGLQSLRIKETDRLHALEVEAAKLGFVFRTTNDSVLTWNGETCTMNAAPIDTYDDHRMAMAFAPVAVAYGIVKINHPEVVSKSYPGFWRDVQSVGFHLDNDLPQQ
jgi:3-phosphoshikimate 1-carboxyvinyltransferase